MAKIFREGPTGALMDEYERAIEDFKKLLVEIDQGDYTSTLYNPEGLSIESITNHVMRAGFGYAVLIRKEFNEPAIKVGKQYDVGTPAQAIAEIDRLMAYTEETLSNKWHVDAERAFNAKIKTPWGQVFDFEQLLEHAIVHILRHRRQIEKMLAGKQNAKTA